MPTFKHIFRFQSSNGGTWSEVWYRDASDITTENQLPAKLQQARLLLLDPLNTWLSDVISQVGNLRITSVNVINTSGRSPVVLPSSVGPAALGWTAVINCSGKSGGTKRWSLRGWTEGDYFRNPTTGIDTVLPGEGVALTNCLNELANANFGILRLQPSSVNVNPYVPISKIDGSRGDGTTDITVSVPVNYLALSRIIIGLTSKKDTPALNGHFTVLKVAQLVAPAVGTVLTIQYRTPNNVLIPNPQGRVRQEIYQATSVVVPTASGFSHIATRTTRGGYRTSRGARRAARLRLLA